MNKSELIGVIAARTDASKVQTGKFLDAALDVIKSAVAMGDSVQLVGFGSFISVRRPARSGRHPRTGAVITIPAVKAVKFTVGQAFKDEVKIGKKT